MICFFIINNCKWFYYGGGLFSAIFLIKSYKKFIILGQVSVFEADAYGLHDELFWFTLSKYCYILSLLFSKNKNFILYSLLIFITSIGYILVGLRGYTIAYGFLLLFFLDIRYRLKIKWLLLVAILVTTISSLILNYRIGIEVNSGLLGIIFNPLLQQGASWQENVLPFAFLYLRQWKTKPENSWRYI